VKKSCEACGNLFETPKSWGKFCGATCRKRASRASAETPREAKIKPVRVPEPPKTREIAPEKPPPAPRWQPVAAHPLISQTTRALEEAGALESVLGQTALRLAEKLAGNFDTGSAMASLSRELRAVMQQALTEGTAKADSLDELAARRMQKASSA
jgi:hypothetical protein